MSKLSVPQIVFFDCTGWDEGPEGTSYTDSRVYAIDVPYTNLIWHRRWFEPGEFSLEMPLSALERLSWGYSASDVLVSLAENRRIAPFFVARIVDDWEYSEVPAFNPSSEVGVVQSASYDTSTGLVTLGGYFAEKFLEREVFQTNYFATKTFEKHIEEFYGSSRRDYLYRCKTGPMMGESKQGDYETLLYNKLTVDRASVPAATYNELIALDFDPCTVGSKVFELCENRELGVQLRVPTNYNFIDAKNYKLEGTIVGGTERDYVFDSALGNIGAGNLTIDTSAAATICAVAYSNDGQAPHGNAKVYGNVASGSGGYDAYTLEVSDMKRSDYSNDSDFWAALKQRASTVLKKNAVSLEFDTSSAYGSDYAAGYGYRGSKSYDLGDYVTVIVGGFSQSMQIVEANEVYKNGCGSVTLSFGTRRRTNIQRALNR